MGAILLIAFLVYLTTYIAVVFSLRNSLKEMMREGSGHDWELIGVLTFFFSAIYFQYKINEYFDTRRVGG